MHTHAQAGRLVSGAYVVSRSPRRDLPVDDIVARANQLERIVVSEIPV